MRRKKKRGSRMARIGLRFANVHDTTMRPTPWHQSPAPACTVDVERRQRLHLPVDLGRQNADLAEAFVIAAARFGFIVAGYSGRDESVMELFRQAAIAKTIPSRMGIIPHTSLKLDLSRIGYPVAAA